MKLHRGGKYYSEIGLIDGNVVGEGVTADDIVAAISKFGYLFVGVQVNAPPILSAGITYPTASSQMMGPYALGTTQSLSFRPYDDKGFGQSQVADKNPNFFFTINFLLENKYASVLDQYPPMLAVTATPTGCHDGSLTETFYFTCGQAEDVVNGTADPHKHFSISLCGKTAGCDSGDYFGYDIKVEVLGSWSNEADFIWSMMPNGLLVVK